MQRVKLLRENEITRLEEQINSWIQAENVHVIHVSISEAGDQNRLTAAVLVES